MVRFFRNPIDIDTGVHALIIIFIVTFRTMNITIHLALMLLFFFMPMCIMAISVFLCDEPIFYVCIFIYPKLI